MLRNIKVSELQGDKTPKYVQCNITRFRVEHRAHSKAPEFRDDENLNALKFRNNQNSEVPELQHYTSYFRALRTCPKTEIVK